eukprot:77596_1
MEEGSKDGRKEIPNGTAVDDENQSKENAQKSIQDGVNANKSNGTAVDDENQSKENENIPEDEPLKDISEKKSNGTDVDDENQSKERGPIQTKGNNSNKENQFQNIAHITDGHNVDKSNNQNQLNIAHITDGSNKNNQSKGIAHITDGHNVDKSNNQNQLNIAHITDGSNKNNQSKGIAHITDGHNVDKSNNQNQLNIAHITDGSNVDNKPNKQNQSISGSDGSDIEIQQPIWMHVTIKQKQYKVKRKDILRILRIEKETENQLIGNTTIQPVWMHATIKQKEYKVQRKDILQLIAHVTDGKRNIKSVN